jgi:autotransporter-associated beta strand protein
LREKLAMIFRARSRCTIAFASLAMLVSARVCAEIVWTGLGVNTNWTTGANWQGGSAPVNDGTEQILFGTSTKTNVVVNTPQSIRRLRFDFSADGIRTYSLSGSGGATLTLGNEGIEIISGSTLALASTESRTASISTALGGAVSFSSSVGLVLGAAQSWTVGESSSLDVASVVSGSGPLTLGGAGYIALSGTNTFTGGTVLQSGSLSLENNAALGTGALTVSGNASIYANSGARTIANVLNLNSSLLDLLPYGGELRFTGPVTLGANTTVRNYGLPVYFSGAIGETGGARSLSVSGYGAIVLSGANTYTGGTSVLSGALLFSNASAVPPTGSLSVSSVGYIGVGFNTNVQSGFILKLSALGTFGTIGFDTDPSSVSATIFAEPISLGALGTSARIGTATRATLSSTAVIAPAIAAGYRFGGGGGTLRVESQLTGLNGVTVDSPTGLPLKVLLTNTTNNYTGLTSVADSALIFGTGAVSTGSADRSFLLSSGGYIGSMDPAISLSAWLTKFATTTVNGIIGFDSADVSAARTINGAFDLTSFVGGTTITLGSASAATLSGTVILPATQTDYHLTGYKGGWLTVDVALSGARGLKIGSASGDYPEFDSVDFTRMSTVFLNGSNTHSAGTTLYSGRLVLGTTSALGTGALTVDGSNASVYPRLETSMTSSPTFTNQLVVKDGFEIGGVNPFTWSGNIIDGVTTGTIRKLGAFNLTLSGNNGGFSGGFYIDAGTLTFATNTAAGTGSLDLGYTNAIASFTTAAPVLHGLAGDSSTSRVNLATGTTLTINQTASAVFRGQIQGDAAIIKTGSGTLRLESASPFTGGTTLSAGTINAGNTGALGTGTITLNGTTSNLKVDSGATLANAVVFGANGGRLSGGGTFASNIIIGTNSVVAPGSSVGTLAFTGGLSLASGGSYDVEIQSATGSAGTGWDHLQVTGALTFSSNVLSPFALNLISLNSGGSGGNVSNFSSGTNYSWAIASATSFVNFNPAALTINATNFTNALNGGSFSLTTSGTNLMLNFTPVPEPSTWALMIAGLGVTGFARLRRMRPRK